MDDPRYEYRVSWSDNSDAWIGRCDGFLLVSHLAPTEAEALDGIRALVADIVADLQADGEPLPRPVPWEWHDAARLDSTVPLFSEGWCDPPLAERVDELLAETGFGT